MGKYDFIKTRLKELGKRQYELAKFVGMEAPHLSAIFKGIRQIQSKEIPAMAEFLNFNIEDFIKYIAGDISEITVKKPISTIFKVGYVQAGVWNEACQLPEDEWEEVSYLINDKYKGKNIFTLGVKGDSMDLIFPPERTTLICCPVSDWIEINGADNLEGKYIVAYRKSPENLYEATVKKYTKIDDNIIILVAESTNPENKPIVLHKDSSEYTITAVVIGDMRIY